MGGGGGGRRRCFGTAQQRVMPEEPAQSRWPITAKISQTRMQADLRRKGGRGGDVKRGGLARDRQDAANCFVTKYTLLPKQ